MSERKPSLPVDARGAIRVRYRGAIGRTCRVYLYVRCVSSDREPLPSPKIPIITQNAPARPTARTQTRTSRAEEPVLRVAKRNTKSQITCAALALVSTDSLARRAQLRTTGLTAGRTAGAAQVASAKSAQPHRVCRAHELRPAGLAHAAHLTASLPHYLTAPNSPPGSPPPPPRRRSRPWTRATTPCRRA